MPGNRPETTAELAKRIAALERMVAELQAQVSKTTTSQRRWWVDDAGRFANDPVFEEIVRLGREYRESLRPRRSKKKS